MTKAELIAAIADAPDDAQVYVLGSDGIGRSEVEVDCEDGDDGHSIFISYRFPETQKDEG